GDTGQNPAPTTVAQGPTTVAQAPPPSGAPTATPDADGVIYYEVQPGDSYWSIAARHGLSIDEIYELNNAGEGSFVQPGERVVVGQAAPPEPTPEPEEESADADAEEAEEAEAAPTEAPPTSTP